MIVPQPQSLKKKDTQHKSYQTHVPTFRSVLFSPSYSTTCGGWLNVWFLTVWVPPKAKGTVIPAARHMVGVPYQEFSWSLK